MGTTTYSDNVHRGLVGELKAQEAFVRRGMRVYVPVDPTDSCDLVVLFPDGFKKVQVKTSSLYDPVPQSTEFTLAHQYRQGAKGLKYTSQEVDFFFLYDLVNDKCFLIPFISAAGRTNIKINYNPKAKNSHHQIRRSEDWLFDNVIRLVTE